MFEVAFPEGDDAPAHAAELGLGLLVALAVAVDLGLPELGAGAGHLEMLAFGMAVPEAAVYEDHGLVFGEDDVGAAGVALVVDSEAVAVGMQELAHQ